MDKNSKKCLEKSLEMSKVLKGNKDVEYLL